MFLLKKYFNFYIYSNIHVAIAAMCLTKITLLEFGIEENLSPLFVFFSTIISYNAIRFINIDKIRDESAAWIKSNKMELSLLNLISLFGLAITAYYLNFKALLVLLPFVLATTLYISPFRIWKLNLRDVPGLKLFLIAFSWAGVTVLFPIVQNELAITNNIILLFFERFLFVIAITIPFDIRDIDYDNPKLFTLPQVIGIRKSKIVGLISIVLFLLIGYYRFKAFNSILIIFLITIISSLLIGFSSKNQSNYYSSFWLEGIPVIWFIMVVTMGS